MKIFDRQKFNFISTKISKNLSIKLVVLNNNFLLMSKFRKESNLQQSYQLDFDNFPRQLRDLKYIIDFL